MGLTSDTGTVLAWYRYHPFGTLESSGGNAGWLSWNRFTFSTKWHDPVTGLHYYGYRWYDPVAGRWPSRDPIGEEGGLNLYGFVENDGTNQWDYLGLDKNEENKCGANRERASRMRGYGLYKDMTNEQLHQKYKELECGPGGKKHKHCLTISLLIQATACEESERSHTDYNPFKICYKKPCCKKDCLQCCALATAVAVKSCSKFRIPGVILACELLAGAAGVDCAFECEKCEE
ncbi:MAG: hypothetical protein CSA26_13040 [Desulfobacterales bacterium]|nr:MAG: hypothetical protein CSA26_13040 [Desulfobacterales bacterium]